MIVVKIIITYMIIGCIVKIVEDIRIRQVLADMEELGITNETKLKEMYEKRKQQPMSIMIWSTILWPMSVAGYLSSKIKTR